MSGFRDRSNFLQLGYPAGIADIGLQDVYRVRLDQVVKGVLAVQPFQPGPRIFSCTDPPGAREVEHFICGDRPGLGLTFCCMVPSLGMNFSCWDWPGLGMIYICWG